MTKKQPIVIGVTGGSGSGKTTVTQAILDQLKGESILVLQQDYYYNNQDDMSMAERLAVNYDHPDAFDTELYLHDIKTLIAGSAIEAPVYDYKEFTRSAQTRHIETADIIILEGIMIFNDERLRNLMDIKVYVDTDDDIRFIRRLQRDVAERGRTVDSVIGQYLATAKPMYHQFIEPTKRYADLIVPEGGENQVAIDLLTLKARDILKGE
ncbi:uridine kinase [Periweissella beninensis]|uniref:Uridine kinase n=1 Tax=Periweissella beninensis TaxID=504936 RepID=A0ABT0VH20_9LACO|nr:uridine kinase [Periweissella beninensis]MBM7544866.1 uridine kinase [Periweissella beninensis]MCM2437133.1 uridine kinase [Periweissella beninensis]MCT4396904.1 uridine kinase [Periweissella beninensis]